ncbi:contactin isoform X2 [Oratosquilla oratoria]|uniref:contactin isoform X2 n=1 Tax=Oratosquilla oratoria TaxID=337810 RepID=UPI003F768D3C
MYTKFFLLYILPAVQVYGQVVRPQRRPGIPKVDSPTLDEDSLKCPKEWMPNEDVCYRFIRSPFKTRDEARTQCQAYGADLVSVGSKDEHIFLTKYLHENDPLLRMWYTSGVQRTTGYWENEADGTSFQDMMGALLPDQQPVPNKNILAYSYSQNTQEWGLLMVSGEDKLLYICEIAKTSLEKLIDEDQERDHEYGIIVSDPEKVDMGPVFTKQPEDAIFDLVRRVVINFISMTCLARAYPHPTYGWFKEVYENDRVVNIKINPLEDPRITVSGGTLIINNPEQVKDRGNYHCRATNKYGTISSESVQVSFAYIAEFITKRSNEYGYQNWGKAISCDPPQHFPDIRYYWARNYFPNFVEEDMRTLVSFDGNLYFSYLDFIDDGLYSCNVQSMMSGVGKNGPFFKLKVQPHANYQQLKFANNFPKAFPESPIRGEDIRLECIAFGYPVPSYNWTRRGGSLPRGHKLSSFNRVLTLPKVEPSDNGEYICTAENGKSSVRNSVFLSIQAKPAFTIPLKDQFVAIQSSLLWECEAFGIPGVDYEWLRNSELLNLETLKEDEHSRYEITDNILSIKNISEKDEAMYQCKASNQLGSAYSSAQLKVLKLAPTFAKEPVQSETYAAEGMNVTIKCNPEAVPRPEFIWRKDGLRLGRSGRLRILRNGNLVITRVTRDDYGNYTCTAKNIYGQDSSSGSLIVLRKPVFYRGPPEAKTGSVGETIGFECEANTDELLDVAYIWRHNNLRIELDDTNYIKEKAYREGYDYEYLAYQRRKEMHHSMTLSETNKENYYQGYISKREPPYQRGRFAGDLLIVNLTLEDGGVYECVAKSPVAKISVFTELTIHGPPGSPGGVSAVDLTSTTARVRWTDGATNGRPIQTYNIEGRTHWTKQWILAAENITAKILDPSNGRNEYQLTEVLSPWSIYEFRVQAVNSLGRGYWSAASPQANTRPDRPFVHPTNIGGGGGRTGDLTITWDPLPKEHQNAPGVYYKVFWRRLDQHPKEQFQNEVLHSRGNIGLHVVTVDPEKYFYTKYEVKVQAWNSMGPGNISEPVEIYSAEDMPQVQPTEVSAMPYNATSLNITWLPIEATRENIRGKLIGYRIKYWLRDGNETDAIVRLKLGTKPHGLIVGLIPNTFYWMRVMAYNSVGSGPESERYLERTWRYPPLTPPNAVRVEDIDPSTIRVTWRGVSPTSLEEPLNGYKIKIWESDQDFAKANETVVRIGSELEAYIHDLTPGKRYKLRVMAFSRGGEGKMSSPPWEFQMGLWSLQE